MDMRHVGLLALVLVSGCARCSNKMHANVRQEPCPEEMVLVVHERVRTCIDRYEASLEGWRFAMPLDDRPGPLPRAVPAKGVKPQVNISQEQAAEACAAAEKRLCTADEWVAGCRGPNGSAYPYGDRYQVSACNEGRASPVASVVGRAGGRLDDPRLAEASGTIEPGGAFPKCVSAFGLYDMHGNVHEWVSDTSPRGPAFGVFLGGFFVDAKLNGEGCAYRTIVHGKNYHDYSTGFRCCKDPR